MGGQAKNNMEQVKELGTGERKLHISLYGVEIPAFARETIIANRCGAFVDMRCICAGPDTEIFYSTENMMQLEAYAGLFVKSVEDGLALFLAVVQAVCHCRDYLVFDGELMLKPEYIYVNDSGRVELLYIPGYSEDVDFAEMMEAAGKCITGSSAMAEYAADALMNEIGEICSRCDDSMAMLRNAEERLRYYSIRSEEVIPCLKEETNMDAIDDFNIMVNNAAHNIQTGIGQRFVNIINDLLS